MNFKERPTRDVNYLDHVRKQFCCACYASGPSDPHHWAGKEEKATGRKVSDYRTVPLCRRCHDYYHATRAIPNASMIDTKLHFLTVQTRMSVSYTHLTLPTSDLV